MLTDTARLPQVYRGGFYRVPAIRWIFNLLLNFAWTVSDISRRNLFGKADPRKVSSDTEFTELVNSFLWITEGSAAYMYNYGNLGRGIDRTFPDNGSGSGSSSANLATSAVTSQQQQVSAFISYLLKSFVILLLKFKMSICMNNNRWQLQYNFLNCSFKTTF